MSNDFNHELPQMFSPVMRLIALLVGAIIALILVDIFFSGNKTNFEDAANFGAVTTSVFSKIGKYPIHCTDSRDFDGCLSGSKYRHAKNTVLWLGNSQLHAINQWVKGETNATPILFNSLAPLGMDLLTFSQPNANLQEHYVLFEYLRQQLPIRFLILPVVFDDLRETGLRDEISFLIRNKFTSNDLKTSGIGKRLVSKANIIATTEINQDTAGIAQTLQESVELSFNQWLEKHSSLWQARTEIRGQIFGQLYLLRNTIFGITATSKRKMMPGRYKDNMDSLEAILIVAKRNNIGVILYIAPFRGGIENPYDKVEYSNFKEEVKILSKRYDITYVNLESLVPEELWGLKASTDMSDSAELDFMHFQAGGHKLLAKRLLELVIKEQKNRDLI